MVIIYVGKKVPEYYQELAGSIHLGKGVWMFSCELKPDWQIIMKEKNKNKKPTKPSEPVTYKYKWTGDKVEFTQEKPNKVQKFLSKLHDSSETDESQDFIKRMINKQRSKPTKKEKKLIEAMK